MAKDIHSGEGQREVLGAVPLAMASVRPRGMRADLRRENLKSGPAVGLVGGVAKAALDAAVDKTAGSGQGQGATTRRTPSFGTDGFLAVMQDEVVLIKEAGAFRKRYEVVGRVPRAGVASAELGSGNRPPLTILLGDGGSWDFEAKQRERGAAVVAALTP